MAGAPSTGTATVNWKNELDRLLDTLETRLAETRASDSLISAYQAAGRELDRIKQEMDTLRTIEAQAYSYGRALLALAFQEKLVFSPWASFPKALSDSLRNVFSMNTAKRDI